MLTREAVFRLARRLGLATILMALGAGPAAADLLISPLRVVFEGRTRQVTVVVTNQSQEPKTYRLEWAEKRAKDDGQYEDVPAEQATGLPVSSKMVQFSPRQVTLAPGESQQVRVALRAPAELPPGEYRSHLSFVSIGQPNRQTSRRQNQPGAGIEVFLNLGFAIPVIVRHGAAEPPGARLAGAQFRLDELNRINLIVDIARSGAFSAYGRLRVYHRENDGAPERQIGMLNNVAMFPEVPNRRNAVILGEGSIERGIIRIVYEGADEYAGRTWFDQSFRVGS